MAVAIALLTSTPIGRDLSNHQGALVLGVFLIPIYTPFRINLLAGFLVLFGIYVLCFANAAKSNGGYLAGLRGLFSGSPQRRLPNWLVVMPVASSTLLLVVLAITVIQSTVGVSTGSLPTLEPYQLLYTLAYAPPLEETMFRISTLGLVVALRVIWSTHAPNRGNVRTETSSSVMIRCANCGAPLNLKVGELTATCSYCGYMQASGGARPLLSITGATQRTSNLRPLILLSFLSPEGAKNQAGLLTFNNNGWRAFHWSEWFFLILTSVGFGLAHFLSGVGWDTGKVTTATLAGLALGVAYLTYGAYASILLHWFFNVYFDIYLLGSTLLCGIFVTLDGLIALLAFATGVIGIVAGIAWLVSETPKGSQTTYMIPSTSSSTQA